MKIAEALSRIYPAFSFEFFPPRNEEGMAQLMAAIGRLRRLASAFVSVPSGARRRRRVPALVSVTYGAGGSSRERTLELVGRFKAELGIEAMAHLTCVGS